MFAARSTAAGTTGLAGIVTGGGGNGVYGEANGEDGAGVAGSSDVGVGVSGSSSSGLAGVHGTSANATAIRGESSSLSKPAMVARAYGGASGIVGFSGDGTATVPDGRVDTGVYGFASGYPSRDPANAIGVYGRSTVGTGVYARADVGGTALHAQGRVTFSRSGRINLTAGKSSVIQAVARLTSASLVFAVVQAGDSGVWVRKVSPQTGKFTILLNTAVTKTTTLAWFALG